MVDSAQMEKFEYEKSNQTYLGNNILLSFCISTTAEEPLEFEMHLD